eukprot:792018-Pyramimonas_sp.AAC.1
MVVTPDQAFASRILGRQFKSHDDHGDDQGLLHQVVRPDEWRYLPAQYNVLWGTHQSASWSSHYDKYKVLRMSSAIKPWNFYTVHNSLGDFHLGTALLYMKDTHDAL